MSDIDRRLASLSPEKRALLEQRLQTRKSEAPPAAASAEPIAIIGMACRFPGGADSPEALWSLLVNGVDAVTEVPPHRWDAAGVYDADPARPGHTNSRHGGFLDGIDRFDPSFFGISPREASRMDPQQRLFLEVAWEALDDAGQDVERLAGSDTGVFAGLHSHASDYYWFDVPHPDRMDAFTGPGTSHNIVTGRLSYLFDFQGPSLIVDTACSSSLVAIHLASQSLRNRETSMALAGGVNLVLSPHFTIALSRLQMLSPTGRCRAFDSKADGFVRSEGCGVIVLKRLADARAAGDRILAVIRGSAVNQDGRTERHHGAEQPVAAESDCAGPCERRRRRPPTSAMSRPTAPARRSVIRLRSRRCRPRSGSRVRPACRAFSGRPRRTWVTPKGPPASPVSSRRCCHCSTAPFRRSRCSSGSTRT